MRVPATEELTCCSPLAARNAGAAMSSSVTAMMTGMMTRRTPRKARRLTASGTRNAAPSTVRPNTTIEGGMCSTAMRMNKNELPQMTEVAANSSSHRAGRREWPVNDP